MKYSVHLTYNQMNLIYQCLQKCNVDEEELKKIQSMMLVAQMSYGVKGAFYEC